VQRVGTQSITLQRIPTTGTESTQDGDSFLFFGYRPPESLVNEIFRYPVLIDAVIQSSGVGMIGQTRSTYALLAGRRVRDWQNGVHKVMKWETKDADDH